MWVISSTTPHNSRATSTPSIWASSTNCKPLSFLIYSLLRLHVACNAALFSAELLNWKINLAEIKTLIKSCFGMGIKSEECHQFPFCEKCFSSPFCLFRWFWIFPHCLSSIKFIICLHASLKYPLMTPDSASSLPANTFIKVWLHLHRICSFITQSKLLMAQHYRSVLYHHAKWPYFTTKNTS